ncbi:MAG: alanine racemase [Actinobacteria bacterium]|nr:alanine racemase [Actinomycetota bacterium]
MTRPARTIRPTWAEIDLGAIEHNVRAVLAHVAPARLCAVVKADGYGHGAVPVTRAVLAAGADGVAVALVEEGADLRAAGIDAPVLVLSEPAPADAHDVVALGLEPTVYSAPGIAALAHAAAAGGAADAAADAADAAGGARRAVRGAEGGGAPAPLPVHLKVDTGMHRVGAPPEDAVALARMVALRPELELASVWTHCAVADEPEHPLTSLQLERFEAVVSELEAAGLRPPELHVANSAAALSLPGARFDMVRCGISLYGIDPSPALAGLVDLRPALRLVSHVGLVKRVDAGEALSYGQRYRLERPSTIATVPIGYADGVRRSWSEVGGQVLVRGRRRPVAGTVTMDQLLVDCGDDPVEVGDEVVLIGRQGGEEITANQMAARLGTIGYEIVCAIGPRVPRRHRCAGGPQPA